MRFSKLFLGACLFCFALLGYGIQPVLTISYDKDLNGVGLTSAVPGTAERKPELAPGKVGNALKSGPATGYVNYPTAGVLNREAGTVEMWVCPLDWKPEDREFHVFFDTADGTENGALYLYKRHTYFLDYPQLNMLTCEHTRGPYFSSTMDMKNWQPGQWHHIAGIWSPEGVMVFIDGKVNHYTGLLTPGKLPTALGRVFRIGDHPWPAIPRTSSSLIDEVRIYDRALTPFHIAAHCEGRYDVSVPLQTNMVRITWSKNPDKSEIAVRVSTGGADVDDKSLNARIGIVRPGESLPDDMPAAVFIRGSAIQNVPLLCKPGAYEIVVRIMQDGRLAMELRRELTVPDMSVWQGSTLGLDDKVLPPWTPLECRNFGSPGRSGSSVKASISLANNTPWQPTSLAVSCWGRDYIFASSAIPEQITSAGQELLARPITVKIGDETQFRGWVADGMPHDSLSPAKTRWERTSQLTGVVAQKPFALDARAILEYDGLLLLEFSLAEMTNAVADSLAIDIPIRPEHAVYRHHFKPGQKAIVGNLPAGEGVVDHDKFIPSYWLGDNDRGLFWICESDEMWPNGGSTNALEIVRSGNEVILRLNLLAKGQKLPLPWKFTCGLQATPVKPRPVDWRKWRLASGRNANVQIVWSLARRDSLRYFGYPEPADDTEWSKVVAGIHAKKMKIMTYLWLSSMSTTCPEWKFFSKQWMMTATLESPSENAASGHAGYAPVSPVGKGYSDFIVGKTAAFVERYGIDGLYHDNSTVYGSANLQAGCGYVRDGKACTTYPILGCRDLYRRMYAVMQSQPRETFSMSHMSGELYVPMLAYDDAYLDGEQFRGKVKDNYMEVITLDAFRAEFMGRQWGIMPFFIPEFPEEHRDTVEPSRGMMALLMLHDISPWPNWACNLATVNEALSALDEFGYVAAEFIPYFDPAPPATTSMKDVYVSAYKRADGRSLLIVGNLSREDRSGQLAINTKCLGRASAKVSSWPDKQALTISDARLQITVPHLGYRLLLVE